MNIFTNDDYRRIQAWLKANAIKDSEFAISENTVPDKDILVITQNMSTVPTNCKIKIKDLLNSSLGKVVIDKITANIVKVNNSLTVDASKVILNNDKGTTLQDVLNYFEDNKLNRHTDNTFDGNLTVKKNITIEGNIKSHDDTITVESDLEATGEITDGHGNLLNDVNSAAKQWSLEYQDPQQDEPTVRAKYVLKDYRGVPKGNVIKIYKDSAITNVYLGTTEDTCNEDTGEITKKPVQDNNEALSIVYRLDTGKYSLVNVPIGIFTREAEFDKYRGLGITENGQVFIKLAGDVESSNYLHFNDMGEVSADGIENRVLQDLGTIINSVANDGTMWGQYKKEEGTKDSPINEASRWGQYKQAEADRSRLLNIVSSKINTLENKIDSLALGAFYGYFPDSESLPREITTSGYAYVGLDNPYKIWNFNGKSWSDSGTSIDMNDTDEEDITRNIDGKLQFKDKEYGDGMGYVILRKNKSFAEQVTKENTIYEIRYDFVLNENTTIPANCVLKFNGGSIRGTYTLVGNNTYIDSNSVCIKKDVIISGTWSNETIYTRWFEFISTDDGITDNVIQFKQLQNIINGTNGCKVEFEYGYYQSSVLRNTPVSYVTIDGVTYPKWPMNEYAKDNEIILHVLEVPYIDINFNGSTIKMINVVYPGATAIRIDGNGNSYIHDGIVIGMAINYDYPSYVNYAGTVANNYEFQSGIYQSGGFCTIYNMNVHHFNGDCITVGSAGWYYRDGRNDPYIKFPAKGYIVRDSEISYCGRNGVTLHSSYNGKLINLHIHHVGSDGPSGTIGTNGIMGRSPQAGIDVEFEDGQYLTPIMNWENLYIHDCRDKSFGFASPSISKMKEFYCKNSIFLGFGLPNNINSETGNNVFSNCYFKQTLSSIEGGLYSNYVTYNDCSFVLDKGQTSMGSYNVFNNCSFIDKRTDALDIYLYSQNEQIDTKFNHCHFDIKGAIGYLGTKSKFYTCTFNIQCIYTWYIADASFYDCIFHNDVQDTNYCFQFTVGNIEIEQGKILSFERCIFDKSYGIGDGMGDKFFNVSKLKLKDCEFKNNLMLIMNDGYNFIIKNITAPNVYARPYSPPDSTLEPYSLYMDTCKFENFYLQVNNDDRYDNSFTIKNSEIASTNNNFNNVNIEGGKVNTGDLTDVKKIRAKNSIIELPKLNSSSTETFNLENCYVSGISEANFKGTAINCTFKVPFPKSGTFASRPISSPIGFKYFCIDKQTIEGGTNGIEIIHKGNNIWCDALGREIS